MFRLVNFAWIEWDRIEVIVTRVEE